MLSRNAELAKARQDYNAECEKLEAGKDGDTSAVLVRIGELQGRAEIIQRKIGEANARLAALQSELANLEAGEQRERDYTRKLEIESRRGDDAAKSDQNSGQLCG